MVRRRRKLSRRRVKEALWWVMATCQKTRAYWRVEKIWKWKELQQVWDWRAWIKM
jgi:hypothetical protein